MGSFVSRSRNPTSPPSADRPASMQHDDTTSSPGRRRSKEGTSPKATPARGDSTHERGSGASLGEKAEVAAKTVVATTGVWRPFNLAQRKADAKVKQLTRSKRFKRSVDEAFDECDLQHDGRIRASELYVALLLLYHRLNAIPLGGGIKKPPTRQEVEAAMKRHDKGGKGYLTRDEFHACAEDMCPNIARGISRQLLTVMVATPLVSKLLWRTIDVTLGRFWPRGAQFAHKWLALPFDILIVPAVASAVVPILFASYDARDGSSTAGTAVSKKSA